MWWLAFLATAGLIFWWVRLGGTRRTVAAHRISHFSPEPAAFARRKAPSAASATGVGSPAQAENTSSVRSSPRARGGQDPPRWFPPGEEIAVGGISIASGMVYVGSAPSSAMHGDADNCVIDPRLPLGEGQDRSGSALPYWPSYGAIQPRERQTYLMWLAGGRSDPGVGIGYVFLFFYGLERRYFVEGARQEHEALAGEARRLLAIYGQNRAFAGYARRFLDVIEALHSADAPPVLSPELSSGYDMALPARVHLGRRLARGEALAADDALTWLLALPDTRLSQAARQNFDDFVALWRVRFAERHPRGLKVRVPKIPLKIAYRAASGAFDGEIEIALDGVAIPDIASVCAPLSGLRDLARACADALEPYNRFVSHSPDLRDTLDAALWLPAELTGSSRNAALSAIRDQLAGILDGHKVAQLAVADLFAILGLAAPAPGAATRIQCNRIGILLDRLDIGFEPDVRYGSSPLMGEGLVLLFTAGNGAPVECDTPAYRSAKCVSEAAVLGGMAGDALSRETYAAISADLRRVDGLGTTERMRLLAHLGFLFADAERRIAVMKGMASLAPDTRAHFAGSVLRAAAADGLAAPARARLMEQLHALLDLPTDGGDSDFEPPAGHSDDPLPAVTPEPSQGTPGTLPDGEEEPEGASISRLLAGVLPEAAQICHAPSVPAGSGMPLFRGLDLAHGRLLAALVSVGSLSRERFEILAGSFRLLPDGARETLDDWSLDTLGEALLTGEDPICIDDRVRGRLAGAESAA